MRSLIFVSDFNKSNITMILSKKCATAWNNIAVARDLRDVVEFVYLLIDLLTIFDTADVETPVFL